MLEKASFLPSLARFCLFGDNCFSPFVEIISFFYPAGKKK